MEDGAYGKFSLSAWGPGIGGYKTFQDRNGRVEDRLDEMVEWVLTRAEVAKKELRISSERRAKAVAYLQEKDKPRLEAEYQARRCKEFERVARQWRRATVLREYVAAVEEVGERAYPAFGDAEELASWLTWAKSYADSVDPIARGEAGKTPPCPEPNPFDRLPGMFLDFDDPAEAGQTLEREPWRRY